MSTYGRHSARSAVTGSTATARRAGRRLAIVITLASTSGTESYIRGSVVLDEEIERVCPVFFLRRQPRRRGTHPRWYVMLAPTPDAVRRETAVPPT